MTETRDTKWNDSENFVKRKTEIGERKRNIICAKLESRYRKGFLFAMNRWMQLIDCFNKQKMTLIWSKDYKGLWREKKKTQTKQFWKIRALSKRMKMKVKKSQRLIASFNRSYSQLCYCITYALFVICIFELFRYQVHVDAYISSANNVTNSFQYLNTHPINGSRRSILQKRNGRFLFDAFFGIDTPPIEAADFEDDDDDEEELPKPCNCGKY